MVRERGLQDTATGKRWHTRCVGAVVRVRAGLPGKEKDSEKPQADAAAAIAWAQKEEWARLKKGFVLVDAAAKAGSPRMHRHVGGGYTGALLATSAERPAWRGEFEMIDTLRFTPDGRHLLAQERYGGWTLPCFDTETCAPRGGWPAFGDLANGDFALDPSSRRMAVAHGGHVDVFDFTTMKRLLRFPVEHVVRRCRIAWVGDDALGVRTDYGCASLYAVD